MAQVVVILAQAAEFDVRAELQLQPGWGYAAWSFAANVLLAKSTAAAVASDRHADNMMALLCCWEMTCVDGTLAGGELAQGNKYAAIEGELEPVIDSVGGKCG